MNEQDNKPLYTIEVTSADLNIDVYSFEAMLDILEQNSKDIILYVSNTLPKSEDETLVFTNLKIGFCDPEEEEVILHDGQLGNPSVYFDARHSAFLKVDDKFKIVSFMREEQEDYRMCYKQCIEFRA